MRSIASEKTCVGFRPWNPLGKSVTIILGAALLIWLAGGSREAIAASQTSGQTSAPSGYSLITTIPLPGLPGHGDWVAYDASNGDIYLSHHGSNFVVVDTKTNRVIANIDSPDLRTPDVIAFDSKYVYVTAEEAGKVVIISKENWKIVGSATTKGPSPDGIWRDSTKDRIYVVSNDANQLEVYDGGSQPTWIATYPLEPPKPKSGPDVGILVPFKDTLYEPDDAVVLAIDPDTGQITGRLDTYLKIGKSGAVKGMVYDPKMNRLWLATTDKEVWVIDPDTLHKIRAVKATEADDEMSFDPGHRLVYVFGGHGFDAYNADTMNHVAYVNTGSSITHTGAVDPATHQVYVYEGQANVLAVYAKR